MHLTKKCAAADLWFEKLQSKKSLAL